MNQEAYNGLDWLINNFLFIGEESLAKHARNADDDGEEQEEDGANVHAKRFKQLGH